MGVVPAFPPSRPDRFVVVGPTASGKSALGLDLARRLIGSGQPAEIVCVDSMTVYRGMDVGTAKPTASERAEVPHHLLDLVDADEEFSVARFQRAARAVLADLGERSVTPVLVGGTGLYVDVVVDDFDLPGRFPEVRATLEAELLDGVPVTELHARLASVDRLAASRMEPTNERRIVRALEVTLGSGRPFSSFGPGLQAARSAGDGPAWRMFGLQWPRPVLAERIAVRYRQQMDAGFLVEVRALRDRYGVSLSRTAAQGLGYRELGAHLAGECTLEDALAEAVGRTVHFAKRQERWFRRDPRITWLDGASATADQVLAAPPSS